MENDDDGDDIGLPETGKFSVSCSVAFLGFFKGGGQLKKSV